ncbi:MAG TPA: amidohydrolase family protein [Gaiellaceae bacterium]|nr:amidohydrolase family protein [Gaiellaceae bacterium]
MRTISADWVVPVAGPPIERGALSIGDDGRIAAVGAAADLGEGERFDDAVILPGFVNAHSHLEYAAYAGFGDGLSFAPWIGLHVARKRRLEQADMEAMARLGAAACLRSGITTVGDCSFSGAAAVACVELGLRAIVYLEVFGTDAGALSGFEEKRDRIDGALSDRVRLGVSPHAPYTCTPALYEVCAALGLPVATHLAESEAELEYLRSGTGPWEALADYLVAPLGSSAITTLAALGVLGPNLVAAHCVQVTADEIALLAETGTHVAHCPRSNALLGCGVAPLAALREAGVSVCIATDSPASTPSFDMFDELRAAVMAARARERRPDALTTADALELATLGGARALGLQHDVGSLEPGKQADIAVVSLVDSPFLPWEDPVGAVVLGGSPDRILATLVAGEDRYRRGGRTWHASTSGAQRARGRMLEA